MRTNSTDPRNPNWRTEAAESRRQRERERELQESRDYEMQSERAAARRAAVFYADVHGYDLTGVNSTNRDEPHNAHAFRAWYASADMPACRNGRWVDLETGIEFCDGAPLLDPRDPVDTDPDNDRD